MLTLSAPPAPPLRHVALVTALFCSPLLVGPAWGQKPGPPTLVPPLVVPGQTYVFGPRDSLEGTCDTSLAPFQSNCVIDTAAPPGTPLSSFVVARNRLSRATAEIRQTHDFVLEAGWGAGRQLDARVTGTVDVRGFLLMIGIGHANVEVVVELLDVTDPLTPLVVGCTTIASHELVSQFSPGVGFGLDIEGGAPYIGGGASICASVPLYFQIQPVRDSVDFVLDATLRRGNAYQLVVRAGSEAEVAATGLGVGGPFGGRAVASFFDPAALADPDVLIPNLLGNFLDRLDELVNERLNVRTNGPFVNVRIFEEGTISGLFNVLKMKAERQGNSIGDLLQSRFGISSTDLRGLAGEFLDVADALLGEDQIDTPGVTATRLCLTVREDAAEERDRQEIESALEQRATVVRHILPAANGGELEQVFAFVEERIAQSAAAGLAVGSAQQSYAQAQSTYALGLYRIAHGHLIDAYRHLASGT